MTDLKELSEKATQELYVISKGGFYYRPNAEGYTKNVDQAGRFTLEQAISYSHPNGPDGPRDGIRYEPAPAHRTGQLVEMPSVEELAGVIYRNSWDPVAEEAGHIAQAIIAHLEGKRG